MKDRQLKVREGHRDYSLKTKPGKGNPIIPLLLLKGSWLEEAGFVIGLPVVVHVSERKLLITPVT